MCHRRGVSPPRAFAIASPAGLPPANPPAGPLRPPGSAGRSRGARRRAEGERPSPRGFLLSSMNAVDPVAIEIELDSAPRPRELAHLVELLDQPLRVDAAGGGEVEVVREPGSGEVPLPKRVP